MLETNHLWFKKSFIHGHFFIDFHHSYTENQDYVQDFPAKCDGYRKEEGFIEGMKGGDPKVIFGF